ncbi:hypothetical protein B0H10DRAFT_2371023 [Mycena sp. CBHHK59/15]|nr:hypothetical protein B0H10DRAFT_2371023 [Mycena sp. CBHHK59/15]
MLLVNLPIPNASAAPPPVRSLDDVCLSIYHLTQLIAMLQSLYSVTDNSPMTNPQNQKWPSGTTSTVGKALDSLAVLLSRGTKGESSRIVAILAGPVLQNRMSAIIATSTRPHTLLLSKNSLSDSSNQQTQPEKAQKNNTKNIQDLLDNPLRRYATFEVFVDAAAKASMGPNGKDNFQVSRFFVAHCFSKLRSRVQEAYEIYLKNAKSLHQWKPAERDEYPADGAGLSLQWSIRTELALTLFDLIGGLFSATQALHDAKVLDQKLLLLVPIIASSEDLHSFLKLIPRALWKLLSLLLHAHSLRGSETNEEIKKDQSLIKDDGDDDDPESAVGFTTDMDDMRKDCPLRENCRLSNCLDLELELRVKLLDVEPTPHSPSQLDDGIVDKWAKMDDWSSEVRRTVISALDQATKMLPYDIPFTPPGKPCNYNPKIVRKGTMHCEAGLLASLFYGPASMSQDPDLVATAEPEVFAKAFEDFRNGGHASRPKPVAEVPRRSAARHVRTSLKSSPKNMMSRSTFGHLGGRIGKDLPYWEGLPQGTCKNSEPLGNIKTFYG